MQNLFTRKFYNLLAHTYNITTLLPSSSVGEMIEEDGIKVDCTVFLFINSGSGGGLGSKILKQEVFEICFEIPIENEKDVRNVKTYFVNMRKNREKGFTILKNLVKHKEKTIGVVCGGDGTVTWVVGSFAEFNIDPLKVPIAIIPLGTGNDFSRNLGWGGEKTVLLEDNYKSLKKLIRKWLHAKERMFDIWDISAEVYENGKLQKVDNGQNSMIESKKIQKTFVNYFSFGIDGKVGYSFDMHRAGSRLGNLITYGVLGIIKGATKTKTVDELIQSFWISPNADDEKKHCENGVCVFKSSLKKPKKQKSALEGEKVQMVEQTEYISKGLMNILFLNIDSYTGGVSSIWTNAKQIFKHNVQKRVEPSYSDGKIEIVSFGSGTGIVMERTFGGFGSRIAQHEGPFRFNFRSYPEVQKHRTYLQIDGQFYRITHPKTVVVGKSKMVKNGQIRVLENDPNYKPFAPS